MCKPVLFHRCDVNETFIKNMRVHTILKSPPHLAGIHAFMRSVNAPSCRCTILQLSMCWSAKLVSVTWLTPVIFHSVFFPLCELSPLLSAFVGVVALSVWNNTTLTFVGCRNKQSDKSAKRNNYRYWMINAVTNSSQKVALCWNLHEFELNVKINNTLFLCTSRSMLHSNIRHKFDI